MPNQTAAAEDDQAQVPEPVVESDIEDPDLSDSFIEDRPVTYEIVEGGTKRRFKKLVSSDGFAYTIKKTAYARSTNWRCSVRNKSLWCKATITQRGNNFVPGPNPHIHPSHPGLLKKTKIIVDVLTEASTHAYKSAGNIVKEKMEQHISDDDFNLPKPTNLIRAINRLRQKIRTTKPTDLMFEINTQFLKSEDFLIGDSTVDSKRHIMLATHNL